MKEKYLICMEGGGGGEVSPVANGNSVVCCATMH